ncbi:hypothetical protein PC119_g4699 [Phytophthora cactorum]|nr:hypothetical protein PC119_g4699 [Phytophthora cactorum]KAG3189077.1 hypothetical protein C6341_g2420 [Phytophthora cactorum]
MRLSLGGSDLIPSNQVREEEKRERERERSVKLVKGSATPSNGSPATAGGSPIVGPASAGQRSVQFDDDGKNQGSESGEIREGEYDEKEKVEDGELCKVKTAAELLGEVEALTLQVGRMGTSRPVERNLSTELDECADDGDDEEHGVAQGGYPPIFPKATRNGDTPSANKVLARLGRR